MHNTRGVVQYAYYAYYTCSLVCTLLLHIDILLLARVVSIQSVYACTQDSMHNTTAVSAYVHTVSIRLVLCIPFSFSHAYMICIRREYEYA